MKHKIEYVEGKNGLKVLKVDGYLLHSKYNPTREAELLCKKEYMENYVHVIFGYGMGFIARKIKEIAQNNETIIIFDPLKEEIGIKDDSVFSNRNFKEFREELEKSLEHFSREVKVVCSPNYDKIDGESYKLFLKVIKDVQMMNSIYDNTIQLWSEKWQENSIHNQVFLSEDNNLNVLYKITNKPIIIASGGPSLNKQLPLLKQIKDRVIILAAGSTINSLITHGIIPDYVASIDGGEANYKHFKNIDVKDTGLIYSTSSHYKIQRDWRGERFVFLGAEDQDDQQKIKLKYSVELPLIAGGGSVANYCYSIATKMTTGPIVLIGQDLAYTKLQSHASGNLHYKEISEEYLISRKAFKTNDYQGEEIYTDYAFLTMKESFETLIKSHPHSAGVYNCTEGGLNIEGFKNQPFEQFVRKVVIGNTYNNKKNDSLKLINWHTIKLNFEEEIKLYHLLEVLCRNMVLTIKKDYYQKYFSQKTLKQLDYTDKKLRSIIENELSISAIMEPLIKKILTKYKEHSAESEVEKFNRVYEQNIEWYTGIQEIMKKMISFTESAIQLGDEISCKN